MFNTYDLIRQHRTSRDRRHVFQIDPMRTEKINLHPRSLVNHLDLGCGSEFLLLDLHMPVLLMSIEVKFLVEDLGGLPSPITQLGPVQHVDLIHADSQRTRYQIHIWLAVTVKGHIRIRNTSVGSVVERIEALERGITASEVAPVRLLYVSFSLVTTNKIAPIQLSMVRLGGS